MKASLQIDWNFQNKWGNKSVVWKYNKIWKRKAIFKNLLIEANETSVPPCKWQWTGPSGGA